MNKLEALFLGIIQGLTEFLPVSSSGHLELAKSIIGSHDMPKESLLFTVVVHAATALSTLVIYRKDVMQILMGLFKFEKNEETEFSIKILISMIPAALIGFFLDSYIENLFSEQVLLVGIMLILTGVLLFVANSAPKTKNGVSKMNALYIGIAQAIAIMPGVSRSGATISTSVLLGINREKAARFSFLMVVPLIFGKILKDVLDGAFATNTIPSANLAIAFVGAFVTGLWACKWMIEIVKKSSLNWFSLYCFFIGFIAIVSVFRGE